MIVSKATKRETEAYSGFQGTDLARKLRRRGVRRLIIGGLATDYCVKQTALDGLESGFKVEVMTDCIKGVNLRRNDSSSALHAMVKSGARLTTSKSVILKGRRAAIGSSS